MNIFAMALSQHDHNTYDGHTHHQMERYTRVKHNFFRTDDFYKEYFKPNDHEIFAYNTTVGGGEETENPSFSDDLEFKPQKLWDYKLRGNIYYIDHHQSHAAYAFLSSKYKESDILAIDGRGWNYTCIFIDKNHNIIDLSEHLPIGRMWNKVSRWLGFPLLGAGKLMGLSAYGQYCDEIHLHLHYVDSDRESAYQKFLHDRLREYKKEDVAATLQQITIEMIQDYVLPLQTSNNICVAGGVAYNGYMNEMLTRHYKNVYVPPAVGDEGQALGTYMHANYNLNKKIHIPNVYRGREYEYKGNEVVDYKEVAQAIADGKIIGWYQGRSESGNRALGNRSILADPRNPNIKDIINSTIKMREDFRPFAPSVLEEHYQEYFDTNQPSPYMSRIVPVKSDKIPGVTHIDGTARIQTVNRNQNERFYDLINEFYKITGIPMLLNTSFNCQEPIVETPEDAINTFNRTQLDLLVIHDYILRKVG